MQTKKYSPAFLFFQDTTEMLSLQVTVLKGLFAFSMKNPSPRKEGLKWHSAWFSSLVLTDTRPAKCFNFSKSQLDQVNSMVFSIFLTEIQKDKGKFVLIQHTGM